MWTLPKLQGGQRSLVHGGRLRQPTADLEQQAEALKEAPCCTASRKLATTPGEGKVHLLLLAQLDDALLEEPVDLQRFVGPYASSRPWKANVE